MMQICFKVISRFVSKFYNVHLVFISYRIPNTAYSRSVHTFTIICLSNSIALLVESLRCTDKDAQLFQLYKARRGCDTQVISHVKRSVCSFSTRRRNGHRTETDERRVRLIVCHSAMSFRYGLFAVVHFRCCVDFAGFRTITVQDQSILLQSAIYPLLLLHLSKVYDPATKDYNYFNMTKREVEATFKLFPMLRVLGQHFLHIGEMVTMLKLTYEEYILLSAILLLPSGEILVCKLQTLMLLT